jgi:hypothetical protein
MGGGDELDQEPEVDGERLMKNDQCPNTKYQTTFNDTMTQ